MRFNLLEKKIRLLYGIGKNLRIVSRVEEGYISQNYILEADSNRFFLKQYADYTEQQIKEIHDVKEYLSKSGIPVIIPIKTLSGDTYFSSKGKYYTLFPFIAGKTTDREKISRSSLKSLAQVLAQIHLLSKDSYPQIINQYQKFWDSNDFIASSKAILNQLEQIDQKTDFDLLATRTLKLKSLIVKGNSITPADLNIRNEFLVHGDYHEKNVFLN